MTASADAAQRVFFAAITARRQPSNIAGGSGDDVESMRRAHRSFAVRCSVAGYSAAGLPMTAAAGFAGRRSKRAQCCVDVLGIRNGVRPSESRPCSCAGLMKRGRQCRPTPEILCQLLSSNAVIVPQAINGSGRAGKVEAALFVVHRRPSDAIPRVSSLRKSTG